MCNLNAKTQIDTDINSKGIHTKKIRAFKDLKLSFDTCDLFLAFDLFVIMS